MKSFWDLRVQSKSSHCRKFIIRPQTEPETKRTRETWERENKKNQRRGWMGEGAGDFVCKKKEDHSKRGLTSFTVNRYF